MIKFYLRRLYRALYFSRVHYFLVWRVLPVSYNVWAHKTRIYERIYDKLL